MLERKSLKNSTITNVKKLESNIARRKFNQTSALALALSMLSAAGCKRNETQAVRGIANTQKADVRSINLRSSLDPDSAADANASQARGAALASIFDLVSNQTYGFATGNEQSNTVVYVLVDPMCTHCGHVWMESLLLLDKVKFVWILMPILGVESMINGSLIIASKTPSDAMNVHEYKLMNKYPLLRAVPEIIEAGRPKMLANGKIANTIRLDSVPMLITKHASGEVVMTVGAIGASEILTLIGQ